MISRDYRFHNYNSVQRVYQRGSRVRGNFLSLQYMFNDRRKNHRAAVVVSRKVNKSTVLRNRIRRRLYEVIRSHEAQITRPYDLVFTVYDEAIINLPPAELDKLVCEQLQTARVLDNPTQASQHAIVRGKD